MLVQRALVRARIQHKHYVLLGHRLLLFPRVNAYKAQHRVGGYCKEPYNGAQHRRQKRYHPANRVCKLLLVLHGYALWHKLAQNKGEIRKYYGYDYNRHGIYRALILLRYAEVPAYCFRKPLSKVIRRKCRAQKARKGYAYLYCGKKARGLLHYFKHLCSLFVAVLRHGTNLFFVK